MTIFKKVLNWSVPLRILLTILRRKRKSFWEKFRYFLTFVIEGRKVKYDPFGPKDCLKVDLGLKYYKTIYKHFVKNIIILKLGHIT